MPRVKDSELDYSSRYGAYFHAGSPFEGVLYDEYPDGALRSETEYKRGSPWGVYRKFGPTGVLLEEGRYYAGYSEGVWRTWHDNGRLAREETHELDTVLSRKAWDRDGKLVEEFRLGQDDPRYEDLVFMRGVHGRAGAGTPDAEPGAAADGGGV